MRILLLLTLFSSSLWAQGNLEFHVVPSRQYLDWDSPGKIGRSFITSRLKAYELNPIKSRRKIALGHGMLHLSCKTSTGEMHDSWSGILGQDDSELTSQLLLKDKIGMGILFYNFEDGHIQDTNDVLSILASFRGRLSTNRHQLPQRIVSRHMSFNINENQCDRLVKLYQAFKNKAFKAAPTAEELKTKTAEEKLLFGLTLNAHELYLKNGPDGVLGGGCTSYVMAFLKEAGIYNSSWTPLTERNVEVGESQNGSVENPISMKDVLFGKKKRHWTAEDDTSISSINFYDPQMIWELFDGALACSGERKTFIGCTPQIQEWLNTNGYTPEVHKIRVNGTNKEKDFERELTGTFINR